MLQVIVGQLFNCTQVTVLRGLVGFCRELVAVHRCLGWGYLGFSGFDRVWKGICPWSVPFVRGFEGCCPCYRRFSPGLAQSVPLVMGSG